MPTDNICNYHPIHSLSIRAIDDRFRRVHKTLCYLSSQTSGGVVSGANEGLSVTGANAQLGYATGGSVSGSFTADRSLDLGGFIFHFEDTSTGASTSFDGADLIVTNGAGKTIELNANSPFIDTIDTTNSTQFHYEAANLQVFGTDIVPCAFIMVDTENTYSVTTSSINISTTSTILIPTMDFYRNTATPANGDIVYDFLMAGNDNAGGRVNYVEFQSISRAVDNGASSGQFDVLIAVPGGGSQRILSMNGDNLNVGVSGVIAPTAKVHIAAGTATANTAPLKFSAGTLLGTLELGAMEFVDNGTTGHLYITLNIGGVLTRVQIV